MGVARHTLGTWCHRDSGVLSLSPRIPAIWRWHRQIPARLLNDAGGQGRAPAPAHSADRILGADLRGASLLSSCWIAQFGLEQVHVDHVVAHAVADDGLAEAAEFPEADLAVRLVAAGVDGQMAQEDAVQVQLVEPVPAQQEQRFTPVSLAEILLLAYQDADLGGTFLVVDIEQNAVADELLIANQADVHVDRVAVGLGDGVLIPGVLLFQCEYLAIVEAQ